jgi:hypothetical protein
MGLISLMLSVVPFAVALLVVPATAAKVEAYCSQSSQIAAARVRWTVVRQSNVDPAHRDESCRAYGNKFFEAAKARQDVAICEEGVDRQRALEMLDAEIDAFNNLIASQCAGS